MIRFWQKDSGNLLAHKEGLNDVQLEFLKDLKEGDRLILWRDKFEDGTVAYKLKIFVPRKGVPLKEDSDEQENT